MTALPRRYYKFIGHSTDLSRTREIVLESKLWFSTPGGFNDPFEARPHIDWGLESSPPTKEYIASMTEQLMPMYSDAERAETVSLGVERLAKPDWTTVLQGIDQQVKDAFRKTSMLCFSTDEKNVLMWSYYASGHAGFCLGFEFPEPWMCDADGTESFEIPIEEVKYADRYPYVKFDSDLRDPLVLEKVVQLAVLTKSNDWLHEKEWRCLRPLILDGHQPFATTALKSVTLGFRMPDPRKEEMKELLRQRNHPIELFQASIEERSFGVRIDRIEY